MTGLADVVKWDVLLQVRYYFYHAYALLAAFYIFLLYVMPASIKPFAALLIIFSDPSVLGFAFLGGLVLFEKRQGTLEAMTVTPLRIRDYLISKVVSLTALALVTSLVIVVAGFGTAVNWPILAAGVVLTSIIYVLIGVVAVVRFRTLNEYFLSALIYLAVLEVPLLGLFGIWEHPVFYLFPAQASIILIRAAFQATAQWQLAYAILYLMVWCGIAYRLAHHQFVKHIVQGAGGSAR